MSDSATTMPAIDQIAAALAAAQAKFTNPPKTKTANAGKYKYRYADLAEIIDHVRPVLGECGLSIVQMTQHDTGGKNSLITWLMHKSGQYLASTYPLPSGAAAQEMGSAITYARRYSLCAILGIAAEEDDDGDKAQTAGGGAADRDQLVNLMGEASVGNKAVMDYCRQQGIGDGRTVDDLTDAAVKQLVDGWPDIAPKIKALAAAARLQPKAQPVAKPEPATTAPADNLAEELPGLPDLSGLPDELAKAMAAATVTKAQLKAYYTGKRHLPDTIEPERIPATYLKQLLKPDNWMQAVKAMKS